MKTELIEIGIKQYKSADPIVLWFNYGPFFGKEWYISSVHLSRMEGVRVIKKLQIKPDKIKSIVRNESEKTITLNLR